MYTVCMRTLHTYIFIGAYILTGTYLTGCAALSSRTRQVLASVHCVSNDVRLKLVYQDYEKSLRWMQSKVAQLEDLLARIAVGEIDFTRTDIENLKDLLDVAKRSRRCLAAGKAGGSAGMEAVPSE